MPSVGGFDEHATPSGGKYRSGPAGGSCWGSVAGLVVLLTGDPTLAGTWSGDPTLARTWCDESCVAGLSLGLHLYQWSRQQHLHSEWTAER